MPTSRRPSRQVVHHDDAHDRPTVIPDPGSVAFAWPSERPTAPRPVIQKVREAFDAGDFATARAIARTVAETDEAYEEAASFIESCAIRIRFQLAIPFGSLLRVPHVVRDTREGLDARAGFVLALIDGTVTIEELLDIAGMPDEESLGILSDLLARGIIEMG